MAAASNAVEQQCLEGSTPAGHSFHDAIGDRLTVGRLAPGTAAQRWSQEVVGQGDDRRCESVRDYLMMRAQVRQRGRAARLGHRRAALVAERLRVRLLVGVLMNVVAFVV